MLKEERRNFRGAKGGPACLFIFLASLLIFIPTPEASGQGPIVISTNPANGASNVSLDLTVVSITFSKPMQNAIGFTTNLWPISSTFSWSPDKMTLFITRTDTQKLRSEVEYTFALNPEGNGFRDLEGNPLPPSTFSFTTLKAFDTLRIPADAAKGFQWPYFLAIPDSLAPSRVLLVAPNNSGFVSDDPVAHESAAYDLLAWLLRDLAMDLGLPLLIPAFPRPLANWWIYTQALDRDSLLTDLQGLQRIDLQLMAMIHDARERLAAMGIFVEEKAFLFGFSASAQFTNRFTLLHPDRIKAAAIGSTGWLTVPVPAWADTGLRYPVGIQDLEMLTGQPFNLQHFKFVPQYSFVGDQDADDAVDYPDAFDDPDRLLIYDLFGDPQYVWERRLKAQEIFDSVESNTTFKIYPSGGHALTSEMLADVRRFFVRYNSLFPDVPTDHWAHDYIRQIYSARVTVGCSSDPLAYCPDAPVTREQMAVFITRALNQVPAEGYCAGGGPFLDVESDRWSCKYIKRLVELGITAGIGQGLFGPEDPVTREQMAVFLTRARGETPPDGYCGTASPFTDVPYNSWSCKFVKKLVELGITMGIGQGLYGPANPVTRAEMAGFLSRAVLID
jgi:pimeloyl-ACP methyl ester carboxylesterase